MPYWVIRVRWSQTDDEAFIVQALTLDGAKAKLQSCNARYYDFVAGPIDKIIS